MRSSPNGVGLIQESMTFRGMARKEVPGFRASVCTGELIEFGGQETLAPIAYGHPERLDVSVLMQGRLRAGTDCAY